MSKSARFFLVLSVLLLAGMAGWIWSTAQASAAKPDMDFPPPEGIDLDVTYISRVPLYKIYCVEYPNPVDGRPGISRLCPGTENEKRWPDPGEIVTFTAHVMNKGTVASPAFGYAWQIDEVEVDSGTLPALAPAAEVTTTYQRPWDHGLSGDGQRVLDDHTVRFTVDPDGAITETYEINNSLEDRTNALSARIAIHPTGYAACNIPVTTSLSFSAEDWIQKQIARWNQSLAESTYPATPPEATDRVRVDSIVITTTAPPEDRSHDITWFLAGDDCRPQDGYYSPDEDIDWGLIHEMCHKAGLIDLYTFNIVGGDVDVTDRAGNTVNMGFIWPNGDFMGGGDTWPHNDSRFFSSHSAGGSASNKGYRRGYYGEYQFDIPEQNYLEVLDNQGLPAAGVQVELYQAGDYLDVAEHRHVDATPDITGTTDVQGRFLLPNRDARGGVTTATGHTLRDNPFGLVNSEGCQNHFLIRLSREKHEEFDWLDITQFNLAYWLGDTISHTFTLTSHVPPPDAPAAPRLAAVRVEGPRAMLTWEPSASPDVVGYRVYRLTPPGGTYVQASGLLTGLSFEEDFSLVENHWDGHRVYAVTAVDTAGRESGFSTFAYAPWLYAPMAVAISPDWSRVALDPWNDSPLLGQWTDGIYSRRLMSGDFILPRSRYLAIDRSSRLLVSDEGFGGPHHMSIHVLDPNGEPVLEFGEQGLDLGQVLTPTGVAWWGAPCTYGGPYEVDEHTLLLLRLDGSYDGAQGEPGMAAGTSFEPGRFGQGVLVNDDDTLTYTAAGNWNLSQGALEFWVRPNWDGADEGYYILFEESTPGNPDNLVRVHGGGWLWVIMQASGTGYGVTHRTADWKAGDWHHVAFTWQDSRLTLFEDGLPVDSTEEGGVPDLPGELLSVGAGLSWSGYRADAVIDELRISDVPRVGNSDSCGRFLVADSGSHRVQAFDDAGQFVSEFGTYGGGDGQFNGPQGLVVDRQGRVIVVDQGNNRLEVLSFDGQTFAYLDSYEAGFSAPTGVAVDAWGHIVVADTGNNRIVVLDAEGNFMGEYTEPNDGYTGVFNAPRGVAVEVDGDLVVADTGNSRVVTVHDALPGWWTIWLPLIVRSQ